MSQTVIVNLFIRELTNTKRHCCSRQTSPGEGGEGEGILGSSFAGYVPMASQSPYPIIVYSVASYRPHDLSHFWANAIVISRTEFNASRQLNIKTTAGTIFQPRISLFLTLFRLGFFGVPGPGGGGGGGFKSPPPPPPIINPKVLTRLS